MRVGWFTALIGLVAFIIILSLNAIGVISDQMLRMFGPALIILFGLELLWRSSRRAESGEQRLRFSIVSIVIVVIIFLVSLIPFANPAFDIFQPKYVSPVEDQLTIGNHIKKIDIQIPDGKIHVTGVTGQELRYEGELSTKANSQSKADEMIREHWKVRENGDTLELILDIPRRIMWFNINFGFQKSAYLNVEVPQELIAFVTTRNGGITVEDMDSEVELKTSNGKVNAYNINGNVNAKTSNGTVTVENVSGELIAKTSNGKIILANIANRVQAETSNGSVTAESAIKGDWYLKTSNGKITLDIPEDSDVKIKARTSNGSYRGDFGWIEDGKTRRISLGKETYDIELRTSNGSIQVNKQ